MAVTNFYTLDEEILAEQTGTDYQSYLPDGLGSTVATVDSALTLRYTGRYKPYGADLSSTGTRPAMTWVGTLGYRRTALSFADFYVRARHYESAAGQWRSVDPLWPEEPSYTYSGVNPVAYIDPLGLGPRKPKHTIGQQIAICKKKKPKLSCFNCVYEALHAGHQYSPQRACEWANQVCGTHTTCGPCGPGSRGFPEAPDCFDGLTKIREFLDYLHGKAGQKACGGYQGIDKLAHCYARCIAVVCADAVGWYYCKWEEVTVETDPEDIDANNLGASIGQDLNGSNAGSGQACFEKCAKAVYGMEAW